MRHNFIFFCNSTYNSFAFKRAKFSFFEGLNMKKLKGLLLGIMAVCFAVVFAACGGGDSEASSDSPREICGERAYHNYIDGKCDNCEKEVTPTEYFTFSETKVNEEKGYEISAVKGSLPVDVVLPDYYKKKAVLSIRQYAFSDEWMTSITIPDTVTLIGSYAFSSCDSLTSITIPDSVTSIEDAAFSCCSKLMSITVDPENKNYQSINGDLYDKNRKSLIQYAIGKTDETFKIPDSVISIGGKAFGECFSLRIVTIGNNVTSIGELAFSGGKSLTSMIIPDGVTSIGEGVFAECFSLTSVTIPDSVTSIGKGAFMKCFSLTSVTIPDSVISIGEDAFGVCGSLTSITIPDSVTTIYNGAFCYCDSLTSITIPDSVRSIQNSAFKGCSNLTSVYYKGTVGEWNKISIDSRLNTELTNATRYYYSETEPTESGNYWHYDKNGQIVVWE